MSPKKSFLRPPSLCCVGQDPDVQAADRGRRGDRRAQPRQVPQGSAAARGGNTPFLLCYLCSLCKFEY